MSICFGTDHSPEALRKWAKKHGIFLHPDVAFLVPTKTMGFGVFARKPLCVGSVIVSCPFATCISPYTEQTTFESPCVKALAEMHLTDNVLFVVLRLMAEAVRPSSPWMPWLRACPRMPDHFFDTTLAGPVFGLTAGADTGEAPVAAAPLSWTGPSQQLREVDVAARWDAAQEVIRRYPEHWPQKRATFELFCECLAQVFSRNFHREEIAGREGPYLLPCLDIINHSATANARFEIRGGGRKHPMEFCVVAARELCRGEQVFCSYGRIGASRFAVEFQFVTESIAREDMLRFSVDVIAEMTSALTSLGVEPSAATVADSGAIRRRIEWLQRLGILCDEGFYVSRLPPAGELRGDKMPAAAAKEIQTLFNVFYLMTVGASKFDNLTHAINREWRAERTPELVALVLRVLGMRAEAANAQLAAAELHLAEAPHHARRNLLRLSLNSELEMVQLLQKYVGEPH
ncbi:uncharacterized protein Tco025E_05768 [Trypanosoma conorhini]|uniref:SET domain-containing protein n=1 Tax=Trypanosoma conorhini TaxID=83891 RepID=A0A3R7RWU3_9TRYP|nr:uncharacterized protein Tco025E_05768 [Trypanosoma conorhini]RNF14696.1 hypothetical protein Tco025E_05768 [Trypanosoma conorhini]